MPGVNVPLFPTTDKLIPLIPDSDLSRLLRIVYSVTEKDPKLLAMIEADLDAYGLKKKKMRLEDRAWLESQGTRLPGLVVTEDDHQNLEITLGMGRPRMPAVLVLFFIMIRGYLGGFKAQKVSMLLAESRTLEICLNNLGYTLPGLSTIIDNVNAVQPATLDKFFDAQIRLALEEGLDDFKQITFDSTDVKANSAWPTDSSLIKKLSSRAVHLVEELKLRSVSVRIPTTVEQLLKDINVSNKEIQLLTGKKEANKKRSKCYQKLFRLAGKILRELKSLYEQLWLKINKINRLPSEKRIIERLCHWLDVDIQNLKLCVHNSKRRINKGEKIPSDEKFYSLSDEDAAMIVKGGREPTLGYKPQLGRSANGFVTALIIPEGNASDSGQLEPIVEDSLSRTGVWPDLLSFDDGYTNAKARDWYKKMEIEISFSGSKGKKIIPPDEYDSDKYKKARNNRSAVESLMFMLKNNHDFEHPMRRGIDAVRSELLEKVLAYNFFRIIELRARKERARHTA